MELPSGRNTKTHRNKIHTTDGIHSLVLQASEKIGECGEMGKGVKAMISSRMSDEACGVSLCLSVFFFQWFTLCFFIEVELIDNVVLVSGVQQSDSVIHVYSFSDSFPISVITKY